MFPLLENSIFILWNMFFLNMRAKNREKIQPLGHFSRRAIGKKNCDFARLGRKIKINRELVGMLQNFTYTFTKIDIEGLQSLGPALGHREGVRRSRTHVGRGPKYIFKVGGVYRNILLWGDI